LIKALQKQAEWLFGEERSFLAPNALRRLQVTVFAMRLPPSDRHGLSSGAVLPACFLNRSPPTPLSKRHGLAHGGALMVRKQTAYCRRIDLPQREVCGRALKQGAGIWLSAMLFPA
jgi:hypothetical protein